MDFQENCKKQKRKTNKQNNKQNENVRVEEENRK